MKDWDRACRELEKTDAALKPLFALYPDKLSATPDAFRTLANAIVGQQISVKAGNAIWNRLEAGLGELSPATVVGASFEELRLCGLSARKVEYLQGIAQAFQSGRIDPRTWTEREDEEILAQLCSLRGVGRWTAEMLLIFHLNRPDVLPLDDIALVRAAAHHFDWPNDKVAPQRLRDRAELWRPWRTVAVWYLWRTQDKEPVQY
jgi:DNA-3-methyladenine glycosylase II